MTARAELSSYRRWVVKVGSALLTASDRGVDRDAIVGWCRQIATLLDAGHEVILVSSGAVAEGVRRLGLPRRPETVHELQAAAAVGQMGLIEAWERGLDTHARHAALVLLTHADLADRERYLNARSTLKTLVAHGTVPVVNENDTVATDEIRFGDNDTLAALVTNLVEADALVILTDQDGLFEADPRRDAVAPLVRQSSVADRRLDTMAGGSGALGRGGMISKVSAARLAARSGAVTVIAHGGGDDVLGAIARGADVGTLLTVEVEPLVARKRWIAGQLRARGELTLDAGAVDVLRHRGRSLLPVGVTGVSGRFERGDVVLCVGPDGAAVARGLVNYASGEVARILGCATGDIQKRLGYVAEPELVHRDNLVLV